MDRHVLLQRLTKEPYRLYGSTLPTYEERFSPLFVEAEHLGFNLPFNSIGSFIDWKKAINPHYFGADMFGQGIPFFDKHVRCVANGLVYPFNNDYSHSLGFENYINFIEGCLFDEQTRKRVSQVVINLTGQSKVDCLVCNAGGPFTFTAPHNTVPRDLDSFIGLMQFYYSITSTQGLILTDFPDTFRDYLAQKSNELNNISSIKSCYVFREEWSGMPDTWLIFKDVNAPATFVF